MYQLVCSPIVHHEQYGTHSHNDEVAVHGNYCAAHSYRRPHPVESSCHCTSKHLAKRRAFL